MQRTYFSLSSECDGSAHPGQTSQQASGSSVRSSTVRLSAPETALFFHEVSAPDTIPVSGPAWQCPVQRCAA